MMWNSRFLNAIERIATALERLVAEERAEQVTTGTQAEAPETTQAVRRQRGDLDYTIHTHEGDLWYVHADCTCGHGMVFRLPQATRGYDEVHGCCGRDWRMSIQNGEPFIIQIKGPR